MTPGSRLRFPAFFLFGLALSGLGHAQQPGSTSLSADAPAAGAPATNSPATGASDSDAQAKADQQTLRNAYQLAGQGKFDAALIGANAVLQAEPQNMFALSLRGNINTEKKLWDLAVKDYQAILQIDGKNSPAKFNLAEIKFRQKDYDGARPGFLDLGKDPDLGDLASYKVFLCDLFGNHEDVASKEFDAFNQVGGNASYYFANAAWDLYHHKPDDAMGWLNSAVRIYAPAKVNLYTSSLRDLGYLHAATQAK